MGLNNDLATRAQPEVITDPNSPALAEFHNFLVKNFRPEEIEDLPVFINELENENPNVHFILTVLRDPQSEHELASAAYGSVQNGVLAIRFTLTEAEARGTGISQEADKLLIDKAKEFCVRKGEELKALVCEAVELSEGYWNRQEIEPGNGMRRIYGQETGKEMHYELPPLAWNSDGTQAQDGITEHLQISIKGYQDKIPVLELENILRNWWQAWYIRPREQFESDDAWGLHKRAVWEILETKILAPIRQVGELTLLSKKEREVTKQ
jgi:RimJ/RimL family protein N-acetyltransferase